MGSFLYKTVSCERSLWLRKRHCKPKSVCGQQRLQYLQQ